MQAEYSKNQDIISVIDTILAEANKIKVAAEKCYNNLSEELKVSCNNNFELFDEIKNLVIDNSNNRGSVSQGNDFLLL